MNKLHYGFALFQATTEISIFKVLSNDSKRCGFKYVLQVAVCGFIQSTKLELPMQQSLSQALRMKKVQGLPPGLALFLLLGKKKKPSFLERKKNKVEENSRTEVASSVFPNT